MRTNLGMQACRMHDIASEQASRQMKGMLVVSEQLRDRLLVSESCGKVRTPGLVGGLPLNFAAGLDFAGCAPLNFGFDIACTTSSRGKPAGRHLMELDCSCCRCFSVL